MADENKLVPKSPSEIVVPVGRANLITTKEEIDEAMDIASRIFHNNKEDSNMDSQPLNEELQSSLDVENNNETTESNDNTKGLTVLTDEQLAALPIAKYGRDRYGRALNKDGSPRKGRSDKGQSRGSYNSRTTVSEVSQEEAATVVDSE